MKTTIIFRFLFLILLNSCNANKDKIKAINLDANNQSNNYIRSIYNSIDTTETTFIIDKQKIKKSKIKSILDTLNTKNYIINVDRKNRIIEMENKRRK